MQSTTMKRLILPLLLASACDDPDLTVDPAREDELGPVSQRGDAGAYGGSFRLNTAKLFLEGMPLRHFDRDGDQVIYDDPRSTRTIFVKVRLAAGGGEFPANTNNLVIEQGSLVINGATYTPGQLLGSEWHYTIADSTHAPRPFVMTVTGVADVDIPGGATLPAYNFSLNSSTKHYDNGPYSACAELDPLTVGNMTWQLADHTPLGVANNFKPMYAATLYGSVRISELGTVINDPTVASVACLSGAVGKAGLWGYPPWVSSYLGRTGVQQLQAATRAIRADFCGNGISNTADGTPLQVRDRYFNQFFDPIEATESVWSTNGSVCRVDADRLDSGAVFNCGGSLSVDCDQSAAGWLNGPDQFMWIKVDPAMTPLVPSHPCNVTGGPGCVDPGIEAVVCADRPSCCITGWTSICVNKVVSLAAADDACCSSGGTCGDPAVYDCVTDLDPSCAISWDSLCTTEVEALGCGLCH